MDLNDDCQMLMLEGLDFPTLLDVAGTNRHFASLVSDILQRTFQKKMVYFQLMTFSGKPMEYDIEISNNYIKIRHFEVAKIF